MRRILLALGLVVAGVVAGTAFTATALTGNVRIDVDNAFACSDSSGSTIATIADSDGTFSARFISIKNDGSNEAFIDFNGGTATTADVRLNASEVFTMYLTDNSSNAYSCVASSGETTTLRVVAMR